MRSGGKVKSREGKNIEMGRDGEERERRSLPYE